MSASQASFLSKARGHEVCQGKGNIHHMVVTMFLTFNKLFTKDKKYTFLALRHMAQRQQGLGATKQSTLSHVEAEIRNVTSSLEICKEKRQLISCVIFFLPSGKRRIIISSQILLFIP